MIYVSIICVSLMLLCLFLFHINNNTETAKELDMIFDDMYKQEDFFWQTREETYAAWRKYHKKAYRMETNESTE